MEEFDFGLSPTLPYKLPSCATCRTIEDGQGNVIDDVPEGKVLSYLMDAQNTVDILCPSVVSQALGDGPLLAPAFGDAVVEFGCNLKDRASVVPPINVVYFKLLLQFKIKCRVSTRWI